jgi:hypothetical protein
MANTSNPALKVIELELRTKGFNIGVVIQSVIIDEPAELLLKTKGLNNCRDRWCNVGTCMTASLMREAKRLFLQHVTRQFRFESPNDDSSFYGPSLGRLQCVRLVVRLHLTPPVLQQQQNQAVLHLSTSHLAYTNVLSDSVITS